MCQHHCLRTTAATGTLYRCLDLKSIDIDMSRLFHGKIFMKRFESSVFHHSLEICASKKTHPVPARSHLIQFKGNLGKILNKGMRT